MQVIDNQNTWSCPLVMSKPSQILPFCALLLLLFLRPALLHSQSGDDTFDEVMRAVSVIIEDFIENSDGSADLDFNTLTEDLYFIYLKPIDINQAEAEQLGELLFLNDLEIASIIDYKNTYGDFLSPYELQAVPGLSDAKARLLIRFVRVDTPKFQKPLVNIEGLATNRNELFIKWKRVLEERAGYKSDGSDPPDYAGSPDYLYTRFVHVNEDNWKTGFTIEKDDGEKWTNSNSTTGLDYLSAYFEKRNVSPLIQQLNIGDYSISLGQGLIVHTSFGFGKSSFTTQIQKAGRQLRHYNSVVENQAFRGIAAILNPSEKLETLFFASYEARDGNLLDVDSLGFRNISSLQSSGLHRTFNEIEDQDAVNELSLGGSLTWREKRYSLSLNTIHHRYDRELIRSDAPYRLFQWEGDALSNYSFDYEAAIGGYSIFGEVAYSSNGGWAQMHGVLKGLDPKLDVGLVYRNYNPRYQSLYANSFGESNLATNENGIYLGLRYRPVSKTEILVYLDFWKNPWLRFRTDSPAYGQEYLIRFDYKPSRNNNFYILYRQELKEENTSEPSRIDFPINRRTQRLRIHGTYKIHPNITFRSRLEGSLFDKGDEHEKGFLAYQDFIFRKIEFPFSVSARFSYFNITDFDARIYAYENDLLYEHYIPAFDGDGLRYYLKCKYNISRHLMLEARIEQTQYFDRETISSGRNEIDASHFTRIKMQVRWRL